MFRRCRRCGPVLVGFWLALQTGDVAAQDTRLALMTPVARPSPAPACSASGDILGTSRTIAVDPAEHRLIGTMQYRETLPLREGEVVLTFDDGPLPPYTERVLDALDAQCVKATFFIVGRMARAYPAAVRDIAARGHTIGTHSQNHPFSFGSLAEARMAQEIDSGIAATRAALEGAPIAPFFRIPGLARSDRAEDALAARGLMAWSADFPADDWRRISASEVRRRALQRLKAKGKGVLLLHDIQPATALALPELLAELKAEGFRVVHVIAADADHPKTPTLMADWRMLPPKPIASIWPAVPRIFPTANIALPVPAPRALGALDDEGRIVRTSQTRDADHAFTPPVLPPLLRAGVDHVAGPEVFAVPGVPSLEGLDFLRIKSVSARPHDRKRLKPAAKRDVRPRPAPAAREAHASAPPLIGRWPFALPGGSAN